MDCVCQFDREYFWNTGLTVMFAVDKPQLYHKPVVRGNIVLFLGRVVALPSFADASVISWMVIVF